jgi:predicted ATPase
MITELSIEGFKSFGSPAETIELGPLNFVVGANASGKSNLLGALRFLQNAVAHDVSYAVSEMGGNAEVRNKRLRQRRQAKPVRLSLKIEKNFRFTSSEDSEKEDHGYVVRSFEYSIVLDLRSDDTTPRIETESLRAQFVRDGESTTVGLERSEDTVVVTDPRHEEGTHTIPVPEQEPTRLALVGVGFFPCQRRSLERR